MINFPLTNHFISLLMNTKKADKLFIVACVLIAIASIGAGYNGAHSINPRLLKSHLYTTLPGLAGFVIAWKAILKLR